MKTCSMYFPLFICCFTFTYQLNLRSYCTTINLVSRSCYTGKGKVVLIQAIITYAEVEVQLVILKF
jgi:hypothetical protein